MTNDECLMTIQCQSSKELTFDIWTLGFDWSLVIGHS